MDDTDIISAPAPDDLAAAHAAAHEVADRPRYDPAVDLDLIDVEDNYRTTIEPGPLRELAGSIRRIRVQVPIKVRPLPGGRFGVVDGERRLRASELEGDDLDTIGPRPTSIPALIEALTDAQVRERQLVANSGRAGVHELDEAERFRLMIDADGHTYETLGQLIGKSPTWVRERVKLLDAPQSARDACRAGRLSASSLLLIARVPVPKLAEEYASAIIAGVTRHGVDGAVVLEPMSHRDAREYGKRYQLSLASAPFDTKEVDLVPAGPACTSCPHNTANAKDLYPEAKKPTCVNPPCFAAKRRAAFDRKAADATRAGVVVLDDKALARVFQPGQGLPSFDSPYVDLGAALPMDLADASGKDTWGALAGKDLPAAVLGRDGTGAARELYDRAEIIKRAEAAGKLAARGEPDRKSKTASMSSAEAKAERAKAAAKLELRRRTARAALAIVAAGAEKEPSSGAKEVALWRFIAGAIVTIMDGRGDAFTHVATRRGLKLGGGGNAEMLALLDLVGTLKQPGQLRALVVEVLAADDAAPVHERPGALFEGATQLYGIDVKALAAEEAAKVKAEQKAAEQAAKAEGGKKPAKPGKGGK